MSTIGRPPIVYVSDGYPKLAETFTARDVRALHAAGLVAFVASLHERSARDPAPDPVLDPRLLLLPSPLGLRSLVAALAWLVRRPKTMSRLMGLALLPHTTPFSWAWQVRAPLHVIWGAGLASRSPRGSHFHAQFMGSASSVAWAAAQLSGGTFSVSVHQDWGLPLARPKLRDALIVLAISEKTRGDLLALAPEVPPARIALCRLGVDVPAGSEGEQAPEAGESSVTRQPLRVVAVGTVGPTKGHDVMLRAMAEAASRGLDVQLDLVGGGAGLAALEGLVRELGLSDRVQLLGPRPHAETLALITRADVVALACRSTPTGDVDGIPIALMEGMAAGKATLSTRVGAIPELIEDGVSGRLVAPDRPSALADALVELAADPALRARLGQAGRRKIIAEYEASGAAIRLVDLLRASLATRTRQESGAACT